MSSYKVEICGVNTAKLPVLKDEEKEALFQRIHAGDEAARQTYIEGNLRLVLSVHSFYAFKHFFNCHFVFSPLLLGFLF